MCGVTRKCPRKLDYISVFFVINRIFVYDACICASYFKKSTRKPVKTKSGDSVVVCSLRKKL